MRRAQLLSVLTAAGVVALAYGIGSHRSANVIETMHQEPKSARTAAAFPTETKSSSREENAPRVQQVTPTRDGSPSRLSDSETTRKLVIGEATREVQRTYALLLKHLDLTADKSDALVSWLIEDRIAHTTTLHASGQPRDEAERSKRIAAIIGHDKLQTFLTLERNISSYAEVEWIGSLLRQNGAPLTDKQRDVLLNVLVTTSSQYPAPPSPERKRRSIESLEHKIAAQDEHQRHVLEQVPAILASKQVQYLFEQYQYLSEKRATALEMQKKLPAEHQNEKTLVWYPARSSN